MFVLFHIYYNQRYKRREMTKLISLMYIHRFCHKTCLTEYLIL